jgi:hypothetical protein
MCLSNRLHKLKTMGDLKYNGRNIMAIAKI